MGFGFATYALGYFSGVLSTLSPCVLPLLPILLGSAATSGRFGARALTAGVMLSFSAMGILLATLGATLGLNEEAFRSVAAMLLVIVGIVLIVPAMQRRFALLANGVAGRGHALLHGLKLGGSGGQFVIGLTLGAVWSPCIGPTLGAAIALASRGKDVAQVTVLMAIYGLGAGTPMLLLGLASRTATARLHSRLSAFGNAGKYVLGGSLCILGILTLGGFDKTLEAAAVDHSPAWLIDLTTRI
ncbi:cytochrome c biogenesis CcdA family protein [Trinickia acidisoli]|uniref:cytochrome c biogenesis CcdA family protein n=1 Tax=Trinickia acidisoli TaxID=2767482 RepID=UPI001A902213|nr:cytochrome c biogenesis CcdA family protein [Trinickia acidisoli]